MKKNRNINSMLFLGIIALLTVNTALVALFYVFTEYSDFRENSDSIKAAYYESQKEQVNDEVLKAVDFIDRQIEISQARLEQSLEHQVDIALAIAEDIYSHNQGKLPKNQIAVKVSDALRPIRFDHRRGYFFICDMKGVCRLEPFNPDLEGTNVLDLQDSEKKYLYREMLKSIKAEKCAFGRYHCPKPGVIGDDHPKLVYVKYFEPLDLFIGTGEYLDDMEAALRKDTAEYISKIRFGKNGYLVISSFEDAFIMHPIHKDWSGKKFSEVDFPSMVQIGQKIKDAAVNEQGAFVEYSMAKPSDGRITKKISYAKSIPQWQWIIGGGVYIPDIDEMIKARRVQMKAGVKNHLIESAIIFVILLSIAVFAASLFAGKIKRGFAVFSEFFQKSAKGSERIDPDMLYFAELKEMATWANQMSHARDESEGQFRKSQKLLTASNKELQSIVYSASHDLRAPLVNIEGFGEELATANKKIAQLVTDLPDSNGKDNISRIIQDDVDVSLRFIRAGTIKMGNLINGLLEVSRKGSAKLEIVPLGMDSLISHVIDSFRFQIEEQQIEISVGKLPGCVGDYVQVSQVFSNFIDNAIKYRSLNRKCQIKISGYTEGDRSIYCVKDNGIGISKEHHERIFELFQKLDPESETTGEGVGLTIVMRILDRLEGDVWVESEPGCGTEFFFELPGLE